MSSPITEYCVHHLPAPVLPKYLAKDGFAAYTSCNGSEVDPWVTRREAYVHLQRLDGPHDLSGAALTIQAMRARGRQQHRLQPFVNVRCSNCSGVNGDPPSARSRDGVLSPTDRRMPQPAPRHCSPTSGTCARTTTTPRTPSRSIRERPQWLQLHVATQWLVRRVAVRRRLVRVEAHAVGTGFLGGTCSRRAEPLGYKTRPPT